MNSSFRFFLAGLKSPWLDQEKTRWGLPEDSDFSRGDVPVQPTTGALPYKVEKIEVRGVPDSDGKFVELIVPAALNEIDMGGSGIPHVQVGLYMQRERERFAQPDKDAAFSSVSVRYPFRNDDQFYQHIDPSNLNHAPRLITAHRPYTSKGGYGCEYVRYDAKLGRLTEVGYSTPGRGTSEILEAVISKETFWPQHCPREIVGYTWSSGKRVVHRAETFEELKQLVVQDDPRPRRWPLEQAPILPPTGALELVRSGQLVHEALSERTFSLSHRNERELTVEKGQRHGPATALESFGS